MAAISVAGAGGEKDSHHRPCGGDTQQNKDRAEKPFAIPYRIALSRIQKCAQPKKEAMY